MGLIDRIKSIFTPGEKPTASPVIISFSNKFNTDPKLEEMHNAATKAVQRINEELGRTVDVNLVTDGGMQENEYVEGKKFNAKRMSENHLKEQEESETSVIRLHITDKQLSEKGKPFGSSHHSQLAGTITMKPVHDKTHVERTHYLYVMIEHLYGHIIGMSHCPDEACCMHKRESQLEVSRFGNARHRVGKRICNNCKSNAHSYKH